MPGFPVLPISQSLLKLMSIEYPLMLSNHLILFRDLLILLSLFPSIRVFSNKSVLRIRWPKYWSFSFSISSSNEYSGLISLKMHWLDCFAVPGTLKSLLQPPQVESINSSEFRLYGPTLILVHDYWKTIALTIWIFVSKVISLLF